MTDLDEDEREARLRVVAYVRALLSERRWTEDQLAAKASINVDTVRDFLATRRWPQTTKRTQIEDALGLEFGYLDRLRRGLVEPEEVGDPVEQAIERSALTRPNKLRLAATYLDMLEAQRGRAQGGGSA